MDKIYVIFWTMGGNTQAMAEAVADGIRKAGKEAEVAFVGTVPADTLKDASAFALGCPAMGAEVLEESAMEPFVTEVEGFAAGKKIRDWEARMMAAGAEVVGGEGVICHETPDEEGLEACRELGEKLANA